MTIPDNDLPGHALILATELPPAEALDAWESLLSDDYDSRRTTGVLIDSTGSFIGASSFLDHGLERVIGVLTLALASATDGLWADRNYDEGTRDLDELIAETIDNDTNLVGRDIAAGIFAVYGDVLRERELARRAVDAAEADDSHQG